MATFNGTPGSDVITTNFSTIGPRFTAQKDVVFLDDGNDVAYAGGRNDTVAGGDGNDEIYGDGNSFGDVGESFGSGRDLLYGDEGDDCLFGQGGNDRLFGGDGCDQILGGDGNDRAWGGNRSDGIDGGEGNDILRGDNGDDLILGGNGDDRIFGGSNGGGFCGDGFDKIDIGDKCYADYLPGKGKGFFFKGDILDGEAGNDIIRGGSGSDLIVGGNGNDQLYGQGGDDVFLWCETGTQTDTIFDFTLGRDQIDLTQVSGGLNVKDVKVTDISGAGPDDTFRVEFRDVDIIVRTNKEVDTLSVGTSGDVDILV
jgi:Ca2+-binding RTX toxin-like protein